MKEVYGDRLMDQFFHLTMLLHRHQHWSRRQYGPAGDAHRGQGRVLAALKLQPEMTQKELSYLLGIRAQSLGELLVKLEKAGYLTRTPSQQDRRAVVIRLTDAGRAAAEQSGGMESVFDCLEETEQANLETYLQKLIAALEREEADAQFRRSGGEDGSGRGRERISRHADRGFRADDESFDGRGRGGADWNHGPSGAQKDGSRRHEHRHRGGNAARGVWDEDAIYACSEEDREE